MFVTVFFLGVDSIAASALYAQDNADRAFPFPHTLKPADETVRFGIIAREVTRPGNAEVAVGTHGAAPGDWVSPIIGGIERVDESTCITMVRNRGRRPYSVGYSFVGVEKDGREAFNQTFSAELEPDEETKQRISGCDEELNLAIVLRSADKR